MAAIPPSGGHGYNNVLFVPRRGGPHSDDAALSIVEAWINLRLGGTYGAEQPGGPSICRLEAPPGYGKSWTLQRFIEKNKTPLQHKLLIFGPFTPPAVYDEAWRMRHISQYLLSAPYSLPAAHFRTSSTTTFPNLVTALVEDVEKLMPRRHLLFVLDDVDQALDLEELESKLLEPIAGLSLNHRVSLLLALRSDFGFHTVEPLRRHSHFIRVVILPFTAPQGRKQILALAANTHVFSTALSARPFVRALLASLPPYTWGIPAVNTQLFETGLAKWRSGVLAWTRDEVLDCHLNALRLPNTPENEEFLRKARELRWSCGQQWRISDFAARLGIDDEAEAAAFRDVLNRLNLIEKPLTATFGFYQFSPHWNSLFEAWP